MDHSAPLRNERQAFAALREYASARARGEYRHRATLDVAALDKAELNTERDALAWAQYNATRSMRRERAALAIFGERAK